MTAVDTALTTCAGACILSQQARRRPLRRAMTRYKQSFWCWWLTRLIGTVTGKPRSDRLGTGAYLKPRGDGLGTGAYLKLRVPVGTSAPEQGLRHRESGTKLWTQVSSCQNVRWKGNAWMLQWFLKHLAVEYLRTVQSVASNLLYTKATKELTLAIFVSMSEFSQG